MGRRQFRPVGAIHHGRTQLMSVGVILCECYDQWGLAIEASSGSCTARLPLSRSKVREHATELTQKSGSGKFDTIAGTERPSQVLYSLHWSNRDRDHSNMKRRISNAYYTLISNMRRLIVRSNRFSP